MLRIPLRALSALLLVVVLAGCGTAAAPGSQAPTAAVPAPTTAADPATPAAQAPTAASAATRSVADAAGQSVAVLAAPQRVLALSEVDLDAMLALEQRPVGTINGRGQQGTPRYLGERAAGIPVVGNVNQPAMEQVIAQQPDLILAGGLADEQILSQLRQIAPTVVTYKVGESWKVALGRVADALNRGAEAERFLAGYTQRAQSLASKLGGGAEVSVVRWNPQGPGYMLNDSFAALLLTDVGLRRPAGQQQPGAGHSPPLSLEALDKIDAEWLLLGTLSPQGDAVEAMRRARDTPAFQQLKAVQKQHLVEVDGSLWTSLGGPLAALAALEDLERTIGGAK